MRIKRKHRDSEEEGDEPLEVIDADLLNLQVRTLLNIMLTVTFLLLLK